MKNILFTICFLLVSSFLMAQQPVKWVFSSNHLGGDEYELVFTGSIDKGWYTYSQTLESDDGPLPTVIEFKPDASYKLAGKAVEGGDIIKVFDKVFNMNLTKFKNKAIFTQKVKVTDASKKITGYISFMACDDEMCLPPRDVDFSFALTPTSGTAPKATTPSPTSTETPKVTPNEAQKTTPSGGNSAINTVPAAPGAVLPASPASVTKSDTSSTAVSATPSATTDPAAENAAVSAAIAAPDDENFKGFFNSKRDIAVTEVVNSCGETEQNSSSAWWIFIAGFLGGLLALLTPCVFPMVPLTVSFFLKSSKDRASGLRNAWIYGAAIVGIYTFIGVAVTAIFGPQMLNEMSTDMYFNLLFFVVFIIFALSFFGLFEITLPSSFVNWSDRNADRGGLLGIFFMAFTLALVSFSCTGPIVGTLLVEAAKANDAANIFGIIPLKPVIGLFGFGLALALPFALFAAFPAMLSSLPKSGGWMDNVKITLGFLELALAFKFLSTADMVRGWGLLKFETFMGIWLLIAGLLALYQFGFFGWKGAKGRPGFGRLLVGGLATVMTIYLANGLFNHKSLSLLSGLAPPLHYSYKAEKVKLTKAKHESGGREIGCPHDLQCFHDFDEAQAEAKRRNLPIFVDFTGHGCVNCRKMEEHVWIEPEILSLIRDKYVLVSLYVDDQTRIFPDDKFKYLMDGLTGDKIRTEGDKWGSFQVNNFGTSSQPYYVLMDNDGKTVLNTPRAYTPDAKEYQEFLECGLDAFQKVEANRSRSLMSQN